MRNIVRWVMKLHFISNLTLTSKSYESKKNAYLQCHQGTFLHDSMSLSGCQINPIDINFRLQKSLETFGKNSTDNVGSEKDRGEKCPASCQLGLMCLKETELFCELTLNSMKLHNPPDPKLRNKVPCPRRPAMPPNISLW